MRFEIECESESEEEGDEKRREENRSKRENALKRERRHRGQHVRGHWWTRIPWLCSLLGAGSQRCSTGPSL